MKTAKYIILITILIGLFFAIDYGFGETRPLEIGMVVHKTFAPPGAYHAIKSPPSKYVIVVVQSNKQRGYWVQVSKKQFYDLDIKDRVPMSKEYGMITGWEYNRRVLLTNEDYMDDQYRMQTKTNN